MHVTLDFEVRSPAGWVIDEASGKVSSPANKQGGLPLVGAPVWLAHPEAAVICLRYDFHDGRGVLRWWPGFALPWDLIKHVSQGGICEAHNFTFEWRVWNLICMRRYGFPAPLTLEQGRCSMAKARRYSLPGSLEKASEVLGLPGKDPEGKRLIGLLCRPNSKTKNRPYFWRDITTDYPLIEAMDRYCGTDVTAEDALSARIPDLTPFEQRVWVADQYINARGVAVDVPAAAALLALFEQYEAQLTGALVELTGGAVTSVNEVATLGGWLAGVGCSVCSLDADAVTDTLKRDDIPESARRVLLIRKELAGANVKKLYTLLRQVSRDGRLRDQYAYCGADRTGRWSSGGVQLQNLTAKGPRTMVCEDCGLPFGVLSHTDPAGCPRCGAWMTKTAEEWTVDYAAQVIADALSLADDIAAFHRIWPDVTGAITGCLRALFVASDGHDLVCCDYSAIEAVVAACLARCQWRVDVFSTHGKIYEASAAKATGIPFEEIVAYKKTHGHHHPARKGVGKIRELAGGYGGWINAWKNFGAEDYFEDDEAIKRDVLKWREESPEIVQMWGGQYRWVGPGRWDYAPELFGLEGAAIASVLYPGRRHRYIDITYWVENDILQCELPSGRILYYHRPRLDPVEDRLNRGPSLRLSYEGYNTNPQKGPVGWMRRETYGGMLFENVVQAAARDIQAEAMVRCEERGYPIVMHTHDELCAEVPEGRGSVEEMTAIMTERPSWAQWWPIRAAGWRGKRYQKD